MHPSLHHAGSIFYISIFFVSALLYSLCSFLFISGPTVNYCTPEQTENFSEIYDLYSLPLVLFYSLPHRNNTTCSPMCCIISPAHPSLPSAYKEASSLDPGSIFLPRASYRIRISQ